MLYSVNFTILVYGSREVIGAMYYSETSYDTEPSLWSTNSVKENQIKQCQEFHRYQQNEPLPLTSNHWTQRERPWHIAGVICLYVVVPFQLEI